MKEFFFSLKLGNIKLEIEIGLTATQFVVLRKCQSYLAQI